MHQTSLHSLGITLKILHLCSYYTGSKVYKNLFQHLSQDKRVLQQEVFIPIRDKNLISRNMFNDENINFHYIQCLNTLTRVIFSLKLIKLTYTFFQLKKKCPNIPKSTITHAHTLYSDGILAYFIYRLHKTPYVITIRGTDVNLAEKLLFQWHPLIRSVLNNSKCVIFISPKHKKIIEKKYKKNIKKSLLIPNGVPDYWIKHSILLKPETDENITTNGIYIGDINKNKNIKRLIQAFFSANPGSKKQLTIIGGTREEYLKIYGKVTSNIEGKIIFKGKIQNKEIIKEHLLQSNIFIMPSHSETFGLTYIEAISQAVPIVYSKNQGVHGYFPSSLVGFPCEPRNILDIKNSIEKTLKTFPKGLDFTHKNINPTLEFSWEKITKQIIHEAY